MEEVDCSDEAVMPRYKGGKQFRISFNSRIQFERNEIRRGTFTAVDYKGHILEQINMSLWDNYA